MLHNSVWGNTFSKKSWVTFWGYVDVTSSIKLWPHLFRRTMLTLSIPQYLCCTQGPVCICCLPLPIYNMSGDSSSSHSTYDSPDIPLANVRYMWYKDWTEETPSSLIHPRMLQTPFPWTITTLTSHIEIKSQHMDKMSWTHALLELVGIPQSTKAGWFQQTFPIQG